MPDRPDSSPDQAGKRAFWIAFIVCALIPLGIVVAAILASGSRSGGYDALFLGALLAVLADLAFLIAGIVLLLTGRRSQGLGLIFGMFVGALVGFGMCIVPLGM
jgi:hypothetical protein